MTILTGLVLAIELMACLPVALAGVVTEATCLPQFDWMYNTRTQSPCLVSAYLESSCSGGDWNTPTVSVGDHYKGPTQADVNSCQCSTVVYSLISACAICQNATGIDSWSEWSYNCTSLYTREFINPIPSDTAVPAWAYLDVVTTDTFNATAAQQEAAKSTSPLVGKKHANQGAIAGGVVGGLLFLGLVGVVAWFVLRRQRTGRARSQPEPMYVNESFSSPPVSYYNSSMTHEVLPLKLYNPADPSTFPATPLTTIHTTSIHRPDHSKQASFGYLPEV